jgi:cell division inhibitor SulA
MPKFIIEREIPNAGALSAVELRGIAKKSCDVLKELGADIQWVQSYVTEDKITCVYIAPNTELIREHARRGGFPADHILEITEIIDPTTAEENQSSATSSSYPSM